MQPTQPSTTRGLRRNAKKRGLDPATFSGRKMFGAINEDQNQNMIGRVVAQWDKDDRRRNDQRLADQLKRLLTKADK